MSAFNEINYQVGKHYQLVNGQIKEVSVQPSLVPLSEASLRALTSDAVHKNIKEKPSDVQVAGNHYKKLAIQPAEYITKNNLGFLEGNAIKYITRWQDKGGFQDLDKAIHCIQLLKEYVTEYENGTNS